jgi:competence CoiA-like predicted nuclease
MIYALDPRTGRKIQAAPHLEGVCPLCRGELLPHCGEILVWHWKHKAGQACDRWSEGETLWHLQWKRRFLSDFVEVLIERDGETHIADVRLPNGTTVELQHSSISTQKIRERERFYGRKLTWVFDAIEPIREERFLPRDHGDYWSFRWKHPRRTLKFVKRRCFLDLGYPQLDEDDELPWHITPSAHRLLDLRMIHLREEEPCGGWGYLVDRDEFLRRLGLPSPPP